MQSCIPPFSRRHSRLWKMWVTNYIFLFLSKGIKIGWNKFKKALPVGLRRRGECNSVVGTDGWNRLPSSGCADDGDGSPERRFSNRWRKRFGRNTKESISQLVIVITRRARNSFLRLRHNSPAACWAPKARIVTN